MKKVLIISLFLTFIFQVKSQNTEVEIYIVQSNTIVKGIIETSSSDSLRIRLDSLHTLAFAKTELEGKDLSVSKEVKKLRRKLIRDESNRTLRLFPGIYQIRNGEKVKGEIIFTLACIGIIGAVGSVGVFVIGLAAVDGLLSLFTVIYNTMLVLAPSAVFFESGRLWDTWDQLHLIKKIVNSRYYYRGEVITVH